MSRKKRIDSLDEQMRVAQGTSRMIKPPPHMYMTEKAGIYFGEIISERAKADWTEHQISLAAMLARVMAELDYNQEKLSKEGAIVRGADDRAIVNPRRKLIGEFLDKVVSVRRSLGIYAAGDKGIDKEDIISRNVAARAHEKAITEAAEDDYIARPIMN